MSLQSSLSALSLRSQDNINALNTQIVTNSSAPLSENLQEHNNFESIQAKTGQVLARLQTENNHSSSSLMSPVTDNSSEESLLKFLPKAHPSPVAEKSREINLIVPQSINASSHSARQSVSKHVDPFAFTAKKMGVTASLLRMEYEELQKAYTSSVLTATCGVEIVRQPVEVSEFLTAFGISQEEFDGFFQYSSDGETCTVNFAGETLAAATGINKTEARKNAEVEVLKTIYKHPIYFQKFLIEVPDSSVSKPLMVLCRFIKKHSKTNGVFEQMFRPGTSRGNPIFSCRVLFNRRDIGYGDGDTQGKASEEASRKFLRDSKSEIENQKQKYFTHLKNSEDKAAFLKSVIKVDDVINIILEYSDEIPLEKLSCVSVTQANRCHTTQPIEKK